MIGRPGGCPYAYLEFAHGPARTQASVNVIFDPEGWRPKQAIQRPESPMQADTGCRRS